MASPNKRRRTDYLPDYWKELPDEIIVKIFCFVNTYLPEIRGNPIPTNDLFQCMAVNKRFLAIAQDPALWKKVHLTSALDKLPADLFPKILKAGRCQYLSLHHCRIMEGEAIFEENTILRYLSIDADDMENPHVMPDLAASCHGLVKLSLNFTDIISCKISDDELV